MTAPEVTARATAAEAGTGKRARATLGTCGAAHFLHDGFSDVLYVLLPLWAQEFGLSLTQVGLLKSLYMGALAMFQIPAGLLAERWGERVLLAAGTAVAGLGFVFLGMSGGFAGLIAVLLFIGSASAPQHPLSSTLVARAYEGGRRRA
ncbi:MAG: MFS transporter, partial [Rhodospirillales bacterium]